MKNLLLDKAFYKSLDYGKFIKQATYMAKHHVVYDGVTNKSEVIASIAQSMTLGSIIVKRKYTTMGFLIGVVATYTYMSNREKRTSYNGTINED